MDFSQPFGGIIPGARGAVLSVLLRTGGGLTGRRVHALARGGHSLGAVQQALRDVERLGLSTTETVGRAQVHRLNTEHIAVEHLRAVASPIDMLRAVVVDAAMGVDAVMVFGSVGRGDARPDSDVDIAVIAGEGWDGRTDLARAIHERLGNDCDILHLTPADLLEPPATRQPLVAEVLRDGVVLLGTLPRQTRARAS